jgi:hypothetical protein
MTDERTDEVGATLPPLNVGCKIMLPSRCLKDTQFFWGITFFQNIQNGTGWATYIAFGFISISNEPPELDKLCCYVETEHIYATTSVLNIVSKSTIENMATVQIFDVI